MPKKKNDMPLPIAKWIEKNVILPREVCASPGPMRLWGFHHGIAEAIADPAIERITLLKPVRVGFSTLLHACIAYFIVEDPSLILCVLPTDADCRRVMVSELERIFAASPKLKGKLPSPKLGDRTGQFRSTILHRLFEGGSLHYVAAKSPRNLRGPTARILLVDEVDAMVGGTEGNSIDLAIDRTVSYSDRKIIIGSTPGDDETSLILPAYAQSDQRIFEVPCPACGAFTEILWPHIEWEPDKPQTAAYRCPSCLALVAEKHKAAMVRKGVWRATAEAPGHAGFRLNSLVSNLSNATWPKLAADFLLKKNDPERLRTFINRFLAQGWRDNANALDEGELASRAEDFDLDHLPVEVLFITAGCDLQDDRAEITIIGHGRDDMFVLGHLVLWGDPRSDDLWHEVDGLLKTRWRHPHGGELRIDAMAIDCGDGDHMRHVLAFTQPRLGRRVIAIKGASGFSRPPLEMAKTRGRQRFFICGVDPLKRGLLSRLAAGRSIRFSKSLDARFYEELASERLVTHYTRGRPSQAFERIKGKRAECLDAMTYAIAAKHVGPMDFLVREAELRHPAGPPPATAPTVIRSRWMEGRRPF